jgi:hypothetical protein
MYKEYNEKGKRYFIFTGELETVLNEIVQFIKDQNIANKLFRITHEQIVTPIYNKIVKIYEKHNYVIFNVRHSITNPKNSIIALCQANLCVEIYQNYMNYYNMSLFKQYENILNLKL